MASVEQIKEFETTVQIESMLHEKFKKEYEEIQKLENKITKLRAVCEESRQNWDKYSRLKSDQFDKILAVQNL